MTRGDLAEVGAVGGERKALDGHGEGDAVRARRQHQRLRAHSARRAGMRTRCNLFVFKIIRR